LTVIPAFFYSKMLPPRYDGHAEEEGK